ncbi:dTDP-L-rhamnose 4-epimerase [Cribrihabitans marinus]|uniref:dTDP-L-rhamnose 4-epimerase n=2 Tax=Cribrihabitans marinus TaxID=1227549 RepID=A0A1H7D5I8_9RHOB|nr:dTDP-L-rhamnose 4-epimerase [Cribrihabitans marinus]
MQEYILQQGFWGSGTEVGILRLQNVYGPGQALGNPYTGVLTIFAQQIAERRILDIYEDGEITRDFVYVDDVVAAFFRMGTVEVMPEGILDIGSGEGTTIVEAARRLLLNMCADDGQLRISGGYRPGDIRHAVADNSRARLELGWQPEFDLVNGMAQLTAWLAEATSSTSGDRNDNRPKPTAALVGFDSDT